MGVLRPSPSVRKLPDSTVSADPGPASPLERDPRSPKGWKKRESDGVGLAIVAALERDGPAKILIGSPRNVHHASLPIAVGSPGAPSGCMNWECTDVACRGFFCGSPPSVGEEVGVFRAADFLSHCYLCRKRLHGKDIYMYRGDKAFCSIECRYQQIVSDEFQEKCGTEVLRPADVSSSPYTGGRLFFTGIAAA